LLSCSAAQLLSPGGAGPGRRACLRCPRSHGSARSRKESCIKSASTLATTLQLRTHTDVRFRRCSCCRTGCRREAVVSPRATFASTKLVAAAIASRCASTWNPVLLSNGSIAAAAAAAAAAYPLVVAASYQPGLVVGGRPARPCQCTATAVSAALHRPGDTVSVTVALYWPGDTHMLLSSAWSGTDGCSVALRRSSRRAQPPAAALRIVLTLVELHVQQMLAVLSAIRNSRICQYRSEPGRIPLAFFQKMQGAFSPP
jgi:hypothetical protein